MNYWLIIVGVIYLGTLITLSYTSFKKTKTAEDYILGGSNFGFIIGMLTFAATLFSTFTFMGMPDFFRNHGIGSWIFLAVSDAIMFFGIIWFGTKLRAKTKTLNYQGISGMLIKLYKNPWAGYIYVIGAFCFLIPYVSIQIQGVSIFLTAMFPTAMPSWGWSLSIVVIMILYSEFGGLRAIVYIDVFQGVLLLVIIWVIAYGCIVQSGGVGEIIRQVTVQQPDLMSVPGPKGLFTTQFLIVSMISIVLIPVTQPQVLTRLIIIKSEKTLRLMSVGLGIFAFTLISATLFIGFYGALNYTGASPEDFLAGVLLHEQTDVVAALVVVGLLAAATSTADSQLFALGAEIRSVLLYHGRSSVNYTRVGILVFGLASLVFSIISGNQLVLLARVSLTGTALLAPMIISAIVRHSPPGKVIVVATGFALVLFLLSLVAFIPDIIGIIRLDLLLLISLGLTALIEGKLSVGIGKPTGANKTEEI